MFSSKAVLFFLRLESNIYSKDRKLFTICAYATKCRRSTSAYVIMFNNNTTGWISLAYAAIGQAHMIYLALHFQEIISETAFKIRNYFLSY